MDVSPLMQAGMILESLGRIEEAAVRSMVMYGAIASTNTG